MSPWDFVDHPRVLAALHALGLLTQICAENALRAALRDVRRPAPREHGWNDSAQPLPRTMYDFVPIDPGMGSLV